MYHRTGQKRPAKCFLCEAPNILEEAVTAGANKWWIVEPHLAHCGLPCYGTTLDKNADRRYVHGWKGHCPRCGDVKESR